MLRRNGPPSLSTMFNIGLRQTSGFGGQLGCVGNPAQPLMDPAVAPLRRVSDEDEIESGGEFRCKEFFGYGILLFQMRSG